MRKTERIKITGTAHYIDGIKSLMSENDDYSMTSKELKDNYSAGDWIFEYDSDARHVELIPEPENEYDSNAVRCEIEGVKVGYVKKGSCSHVKNVMKSPHFKGIMIDKLYYGKVKKIYSDDDDKEYVEKDNFETPVVQLLLITEDNTQAVIPEAPPVTITEEPKKSGLFGYLKSFFK